MDLNDFRSQILSGLLDNNEQIVKQSEGNFYSLLNENPCLALQLLVANSNSNDQSNFISITLLGVAALFLSDRLNQIGDIEFHQNFQSSLLLLLQNPSFPPHLLSNLSFIVSRYSKIYSANWPSLFDNLLHIIQNSDKSSFAIDCLSFCISNNSIICNDQALEAIIQIIQTILSNAPFLDLQFFSTMKLIFSIYQCENVNELFKSNLKAFSEKLISISFENSDPSLPDNFMVELSNFCDDNIEFFEPSFENLINLLCSKIISQQNSEIVENASILILEDIFGNKKYVKNFVAKSLEIYNLLVKVISSKLPEIDIDPNEGENESNESNSISIAKDTIISIAQNYGGIIDVSIYLFSSFTEPQFDDLGLFISNFIAFGCVIRNIIEFIDLPSFIPSIIPIYQMGFSNQNLNCRYRSIVSLKKVLNALSNFSTDLDIELEIDSQSIISLIFDALGKENVPANITALLSALKSCLKTFDDYHDNISNIIVPLEQSFNSFTVQQQSIIISCYSYCACLCESNDPFTELMLGIFNRIITVLRDGGQNFPSELFFTCLDSVLDFDKFLPPESFIELSSLILKFISSFNTIPNPNGSNNENTMTTMMDILTYKQIDIVNRTIRGLIRLCPKDQFLAFSNQVFQPIFLLALTDINPEKFPFDVNKSELQTNYEVIRCPDESKWICYSKVSIDNVYEALHTIHAIIDKFPEIIDPYLQQLLNIIQKWVNDCFSFTLVFKCVKILTLLLNSPQMKAPEVEIFLLNIFLKAIMAFDLIGDGNNGKDPSIGQITIEFIRLYNKLFEFIGINFNSPNSLSIVIGANTNNPINLIFKLYTKWTQIHQVILQSSDDQNANNFIETCNDIEIEIGTMFDPIFKYFSCPPVGQKLLPIMFQFFPMDFDASYFITPTLVGVYSSFAVYSSLCNEEQIVKIGSLFTQIVMNGLNSNFPLYVTESAAESILRLVNSGRVSPEFLLFLIEKVEQAIQIRKDKIASYVIPQLLIFIERIFKNALDIKLNNEQKDSFVTRLISLLLNCLPVNYLVINDFTYLSAESFLILLSINHPILNDPHNLALICNLAFVFIKIHKPPKPVLNQLKAFIKSVFYSEQGQLVYNELATFPLTPRLAKNCVDYINMIMKSQNQQRK